MSLFHKKQIDQPPLTNQNIGKWGEKHAAHFLRKHGFKILKRNYKTMGGEIDLIASKNNVLVFIEVKTQDGKGPISPEKRVGYYKQKQIGKLAKHYLTKSKGTYSEVRLDVISVYRCENGPDIHHIEGAFDLIE